MIKIKIDKQHDTGIIETEKGLALLDILRVNGYNIYSPCGGKGRCGKCLVKVEGIGDVTSCNYFPDTDIEISLPGEDEAVIAVHQTEFLEDLPFKREKNGSYTARPHGIAIDIGTTTVVIYFLDLLTGKLEKVSSMLNPQKQFGGDVITRITYCQEHKNGLEVLKNEITSSINKEIVKFTVEQGLQPANIEEVIVVGNTTMLHLFLGEDPLSIALAPFTPRFVSRQEKKGNETGLKVNPEAQVVTLPCVSAYVGADILAGLAVLNVQQKNYLFLDIGTNGELALVKGHNVYTCATAAGPAFEGANILCGMAAVNGAISGFSADGEMTVIGNRSPAGICGSGIVDLVSYLLDKKLVDENGLMREPFIINGKVKVVQQDIREIQLAKSAIYSGIRILVKHAGMSFSDIDALFLAGGFGNYINPQSAMDIGLLPEEMKGRIYPVGNSAGIGALQYLKNDDFRVKADNVLRNIEYIELSYIDEFALEFALNMSFRSDASQEEMIQ